MESLGYIIKKLRENKGLTQEELAKQLGISRGSLSMFEIDKREPDNNILVKLADFFDVPTDYLLRRGVLLPPIGSGKSANLQFLINNSTLQNKKILIVKNPDEQIFAKSTVPLLGTIRAGLPLLAEDNWEEQIEAPAHLQADFALRVAGDSMSWAGIHDGDLAILKKIDIPSHGMIVAAGIEDATWEATLKFYVKENGHPVLRAANPDYEDIVITSEHRIVGHVVSVQKEPPSLQDYRNVLLPKEMMDKSWQDTIEKATQKGMDGEKVGKLIELFADMAKNL